MSLGPFTRQNIPLDFNNMSMKDMQHHDKVHNTVWGLKHVKWCDWDYVRAGGAVNLQQTKRMGQCETAFPLGEGE